MKAHDRHTFTTIRLDDYRPPIWRVETVELEFDLGIECTEVTTRLVLRGSCASKEPLWLDGEDLELLSIQLDGAPLAATAWRHDAHGLTVDGIHDGSTLETRVRLYPATRTELEGLYLSGERDTGFLLTQCEAQGFRRITFFPDRPDVMATYTVTLRADRARFPVLLAGGNPDGAGELTDGGHWARFVDPYPKPSYLFALVAGRLEKLQRTFITSRDRTVNLFIWSEADVIDHCHYAMDALVRAMQWDEQTYGRDYDLDVFHVVATHDFNMGAMENKGLNIFNTKYLLADPDSTTDDEYRAIEAVVAHEYFHNWSGNRVTCRDWFQLSLKEGFTVFREQCFSAAMHSASLKRIEDVALLRGTQFIEDAGPLAHPVRPAQYREINNFYTATVYEKGAELVRMLAGHLGTEGFRRGTDLYFERHDGQAVTIEDFLIALGQANQIDLSPYLAWYSQAGTPRLKAHGVYDATKCRYTLILSQYTPPGTGRKPGQALPVPVKMALFNHDGQRLPLHLNGNPDNLGHETVIVLDKVQKSFVFEQVATEPVPSLLRGFSAPVILEYDYRAYELVLLLRYDVDGFNRWETSQQLATRAFDALRDGGKDTLPTIWSEVLASLLTNFTMDQDHALLAALLTPPGEQELAQRQNDVDPDQIHVLRQALRTRLAQRIGQEVLVTRYQLMHGVSNASDSGPVGQAARRLRQCVLALLALIDRTRAEALAIQQYDHAQGMTDRLDALNILVQGSSPQVKVKLMHFRARYNTHALALDKWFTVQATVPGEATLARVLQLESDPDFTLKNPNRVNALLGAFAKGNPSGFHRPDGAAYRLLAKHLTQLDTLNPPIAARLATAFNGWKKLEPVRRSAALQVMNQLAAQANLSSDLGEILDNMLQNQAQAPPKDRLTGNLS